MSSRSDLDPEIDRSPATDEPDLTRYSHVKTQDGELVIYDEATEDAWFQCSFWIQVEMME